MRACEIGIVGRDRAAFAHGDGLHRMEREAGHACCSGNRRPRAGCRQRVAGRRARGRHPRRRRARRPARPPQCRPCRRLAAEMHGQTARDLRPSRGPRQRRLQRCGVIRPVSGSTSANTHLGADVARGVGGRQEGERGTIAASPALEPERQRRKMQRRGAVVAGDRMRGADALGEGRPRTPSTVGPGRQLVAAQDLGDRGDVVVVDAVPAIGQEAPASGSLPGSSRSMALQPVARRAIRRWCRWRSGSPRRPACAVGREGPAVQPGEAGLDHVAVVELDAWCARRPR